MTYRTRDITKGSHLKLIWSFSSFVYTCFILGNLVPFDKDCSYLNVKQKISKHYHFLASGHCLFTNFWIQNFCCSIASYLDYLNYRLVIISTIISFFLTVKFYCTEMVSGWTDAIPHQDYLGWLLGRMVILHIRPTRQRARWPFSEKSCRICVEDQIKIMSPFFILIRQFLELRV